MKKLLSNKAYIAVFVAPGLILFLVMAVIPLFTTGYYGLFNYDGIGEKVFIGLKNYKELFTTDPYFLRSVLNSFILAAGSLFIQIPIALFLAILLANGIKGEGFYRTVFFLPVVISSMVIGQLWCAFFPGESQRRAIYTGFSCTCVKGNAAASQADILLDKFASGKAADAGFQLFEMKWLGEVIVGSQIQPFYLILDLYSCGEYENRSIGIEGTELTQDFQTVNSRQVQIQKD